MWRAHSANEIFLSGIVIIGHPFLSRPHTKVPTTAGARWAHCWGPHPNLADPDVELYPMQSNTRVPCTSAMHVSVDHLESQSC